MPCSVCQKERGRFLRSSNRVCTLYSVGRQWGSLSVPGPVAVRGGRGVLLGGRGMWVPPLHLHQAVRVTVMDPRHCQVTIGNQILQPISAQNEASH